MNKPCDYCIGIYRSTPSSPKRKYKYCPMCGRKLDFSICPICGKERESVRMNKQEIEKAIEMMKERYKFAKENYLEEVPEYVEALRMSVEALEKQIPKKPIEQRYVNNELIGICPSCQLRWDVAYWQRHCSNCGQKLDWRVKK